MQKVGGGEKISLPPNYMVGGRPSPLPPTFLSSYAYGQHQNQANHFRSNSRKHHTVKTMRMMQMMLSHCRWKDSRSQLTYRQRWRRGDAKKKYFGHKITFLLVPVNVKQLMTVSLCPSGFTAFVLSLGKNLT